MLVVSVADSLSERESEKLRESVSVWLRVGESDGVGSDDETDVDSVSSREIVGTAVSVSSCVADSDAVRCVTDSETEAEAERLSEGVAVVDCEALSLEEWDEVSDSDAEDESEAESVVDSVEELESD